MGQPGLDAFSTPWCEKRLMTRYPPPPSDFEPAVPRSGRPLAAAFAMTACVLATTALAAGSEGDAMVGNWKPDDRETVLSITRAGSAYSALAPATDGGTIDLFRGVTWDAESKTWKGELYASKRSAWVSAVLRLENPNTLVLKVSSGIFTKEVTWLRSPPPKQP